MFIVWLTFFLLFLFRRWWSRSHVVRRRLSRISRWRGANSTTSWERAPTRYWRRSCAGAFKRESTRKNNKTRENSKERRQSGKEYVSTNGKQMPARTMRNVECDCKFRCKNNFSIDERREMHQKFWNSKSWQVQSNFIISSVRVTKPKRTTVPHSSRIKATRSYILNGKPICQKVFLATLAINHMRVDYCLNHMNINGLCSPDRRGGATLNKITTELTEAVRKFLQKFPKFKSHYSDSDRIYFHPDLTVKSLHEIYKEQIETGKKAVSLSI